MGEQKSKADAMNRVCSVYRGIIINSSIQVETLIEIIVSYMIGDKRSAMMDVFSVLNINQSITYSSKVNSFKFLVGKYYPNFFDKHPNFKKNIDHLVETRNVVAHRRLTTYQEDIDAFDGHTIKIIWLTTSSNKPKKKELIIDKTSMDVYNKMFDEIIDQLSELWEIVSQKESLK